MYSQHNKSTSGHRVNIARAPPPHTHPTHPPHPAHIIQNNEDITIFRMASLPL